MQGQWLNGVMDGLGVRVRSNGRVQSGLWRDGRLVHEVPLSRCSATVHAASDAAKAASSHTVGMSCAIANPCGHLGNSTTTLLDVLQATGDHSAFLNRVVLVQPAAWVALATLAAQVVSSSMPPSILATADALSILHAPLAFLAMGIHAGGSSVSSLQHSVAPILAMCHVPALLTSTALLMAQQTVLAAATLLLSLGGTARLLPIFLCSAVPFTNTS